MLILCALVLVFVQKTLYTQYLEMLAKRNPKAAAEYPMETFLQDAAIGVMMMWLYVSDYLCNCVCSYCWKYGMRVWLGSYGMHPTFLGHF